MKLRQSRMKIASCAHGRSLTVGSYFYTLYAYACDVCGCNWSFLDHVTAFFQLRTLTSHLVVNLLEILIL